MIDQKQARDVAAKAMELVYGFESVTKNRPLTLLPKEGENIHSELRLFANYTVLSEHRNDWGLNGFLTRDIAETLPLFMAADVSTVGTSQPRHLSGYASWLWRNYPGSYAAVLDEHLIVTVAPNYRLTIPETTVRLYLHELGHFVLHRAQLFQAHLWRAELATRARPEMEEEAWFFAYVVLGLARGDRAFFTASSDIDDTWFYWP